MNSSGTSSLSPYHLNPAFKGCIIFPSFQLLNAREAREPAVYCKHCSCDEFRRVGAQEADCPKNFFRLSEPPERGFADDVLAPFRETAVGVCEKSSILRAYKESGRDRIHPYTLADFLGELDCQPFCEIVYACLCVRVP